MTFTGRPYRLRLYYPWPAGRRLGPHVRTFTTLAAAEQYACEERILARRNGSRPIIGYQIVNRTEGGAIEADVMFPETTP